MYSEREKRTPRLDMSMELQIPQHWDCPSRGNPNVKILQLDVKKGLLATKEDDYTSDTLFGYNGKSLTYRSWSHPPSAPSCGLHYNAMGIEIEGDLGYYFYGRDASPGLMSDMSIDIFAGSTRDNSLDLLAKFRFGGSKLDNIRLNSLFYSSEKKGKILGPEIAIDFGADNTTKLIDGDGNDGWKRSADIGENPTVVKYLNREDIVCFALSWEKTDERLIVRELHLGSGIVKILETPLRIDLKKINEAVFSQAPYEIIKSKTGPDRLDVPWRNIDQIVGASLSYSFPLPQNKLGQLGSF